MPELPEMETYRIQLSERLSGARIEAVDVGREKSINVPPDAFRAIVTGARVVRLERRGKTIAFRLDNGRALLVHLMLGGSMFFGTDEEAPRRTAQVILSFGKRRLYFHGLRLGYLHVYSEAELAAKFAKLGPEPLDPGFSSADFASLLFRRKGILKSALTDQSVIAGIGNCYSDEICFAAAVRPLRRTADMPEEDAAGLYDAMRATLLEAIRWGGYMETPFSADDSHTGRFNDRCSVYDRGGEPCLRCGSPVIRTEHSGRKVFYCGHCQR